MSRAARGPGPRRTRLAVHSGRAAVFRAVGAASAVAVNVSVLAVAGYDAPLLAQEAGPPPESPPDSPLVIHRGWLPVATVTMAFPASSRTYRGELLARVSDLALLAAVREATAGLPVQVTYDSDATGRYLVAATTPEASDSVLRAMRHAARTPLPARLVQDAVAGMRSDLVFRGDLPRSHFDRILDAHLRGDGNAGEAAAAPIPEVEAIGAEIALAAPADRWGTPSWVVVGDGEALPAGETSVPPVPVAAGAPSSASPPVRDHVPADVITRWVGSVFRFPAQTTLVEAYFVKLALERLVEDRRDPALFEFDTEIDAPGRLVVRFSTSAGASADWEARLDETIRQLGSGEGGARLDQLLPPVYSRWSLELAPAPGAGRAAAEALLRGATGPQAAAFANSAANPPAGDRLRAVARGMSLELRVVYGSS